MTIANSERINQYGAWLADGGLSYLGPHDEGELWTDTEVTAFIDHGNAENTAAVAYAWAGDGMNAHDGADGPKGTGHRTMANPDDVERVLDALRLDLSTGTVMEVWIAHPFDGRTGEPVEMRVWATGLIITDPENMDFGRWYIDLSGHYTMIAAGGARMSTHSLDFDCGEGEPLDERPTEDELHEAITETMMSPETFDPEDNPRRVG